MRIGLFLSVGVKQHHYKTSFVWEAIAPIFSNDWISLAASTLSIFIIAFIFSDLNTRFTLMRFRTSLPFALVLFLLSIHPLFLRMSPNYISTIFILFSLSLKSLHASFILIELIYSLKPSPSLSFIICEI